MRVLFVSGDYPPDHGGIASYVSCLASVLRKRGHEVSVIARNRTGRAVTEREIEGIRILRVPCPPIYPLHVWIQGKLYKKVFRDEIAGNDVVHYHSPLVPFIDSETPSIATVHVLIAEYLSEGISEFGADFAFARLAYPFVSLEERRCISRVDEAIALHGGTVDGIAQIRGTTGAEVHVIPPGVDGEFYGVRSRGAELGTKFFLYSGRLIERKGLKVLVHAYALFASRYKDVRLILTGTGPLEKQLRVLAHRLGVGDSVQLLGKVDESLLRDLYSSCTAFLLPSFYEGISISVLEAMACGAPTVVTRLPGFSSVFTHEREVLMVEPGDVHALSSAMAQLYVNRDEAFNLARRGRDFVLTNMDWRVLSSRFEEVYRIALS